MTEGIIVGVLSLIGTLAGTYFANRKSSALIAYRLELLEKKVDKHNSVVERTFKLEEQAAVIEEKIKVANHRIEDLETGEIAQKETRVFQNHYNHSRSRHACRDGFYYGRCMENKRHRAAGVSDPFGLR